VSPWLIPLVKGSESEFSRMFERPFGYWRTACWRCPSGSLIGSLLATAERRS